MNEQGIQQTVDPIGSGLAVRCDLGSPDDVDGDARPGAGRDGRGGHPDPLRGDHLLRKGIGAFPVDEWDLVLDVNLRGTYLVCRAFMEGMKDRSGWGRIVDLFLARRPRGRHRGRAALYRLQGGADRLYAHAGQRGRPVRDHVNAVAPGIILTEPVKKQVAGHEEDYTAQIPLRRLGKPEDVANVVLFLVSPLSAYITGVGAGHQRRHVYGVDTMSNQSPIQASERSMNQSDTCPCGCNC